ncbi:AAA family ATPase [Deinococcus malanensis]|uniref:AAA family ATPase n=1 Tax=Deinococcus malanensis TaxID=1706855 RepID=UPI0036420D4B
MRSALPGSHHPPDGTGLAETTCPTCGQVQPFHFRPLPVITGASGSGKSTLAARLAGRSGTIFAFENDILWGPQYDTPQDGYRAFRTALLRVALNVNQTSVTAALFTSVMPPDLTSHPLARYFDGLHFLVLECPDQVLADRLRARPAWRSSDSHAFIAAMQTFNRHLQAFQAATTTHLDTSTVPLREADTALQRWMDTVLSSTSGDQGAIPEPLQGPASPR